MLMKAIFPPLFIATILGFDIIKSCTAYPLKTLIFLGYSFLALNINKKMKIFTSQRHCIHILFLCYFRHRNVYCRQKISYQLFHGSLNPKKQLFILHLFPTQQIHRLTNIQHIRFCYLAHYLFEKSQVQNSWSRFQVSDPSI